MKTLKGIQRIGYYKKTKVFVDWGYLLNFHGKRKELEDVQISIGRLLRILSAIYIIAFLGLQLFQGRILTLDIFLVDTNLKLLWWVAISMSSYSIYLLRDRSEFIDTLEIKKLQHLRILEKQENLHGDIEISDYFDYDILYILDDLLVEDKRFFQKLLIKLTTLHKVISLMDRIGINNETLIKIISTSELEIQGSRDRLLSSILLGSFFLALKYGFESIDESVIFLYIVKNILNRILVKFKVLPEEIDGLLLWVQNKAKEEHYMELWRNTASLKPKNTINRAYTSRIATTLEAFKRDFTLEVIKGDFTLSVARDDSLNEIIRLLHQGNKGAILMVGAPGVGKTTMIKSLALRMVVEDVPKELADKRLVGFDFNKAYALAGSIDNFRRIVETVLTEVSKAKNIIFVIDDFDQLVNIRQAAANEVMNLVVKAIDQYNLRILATSSKSGYITNIKARKGLVALFDIVNIEEPSDQVALQILLDELPHIEHKYNLTVSVDALRTAIKLSHDFEFDRVLPEKAIDLIEEGATYAKELGLKFLSQEEIEKLVSKKVGVNIGEISNEEQGKLEHLEEIMHKRVVGQDRAINAVADALRRSRAGLSSTNRPIAAFLFFGPTGVGKTEVAKTLASTYYGGEHLMIRLDMSEYQEESNLSRLIGYRKGDDFFGGRLTTSVREKPFSLLLLDEIEKANPKVLDLFLQILDEGSITDGVGRHVDFTNIIIVATSNVGSTKLAQLIEKGIGYDKVYKQIMPLMRAKFRIEFLNRFDDVVMFKPLEKDQVAQIAVLFLKKVGRRLHDNGIYFKFEHTLVDELVKVGYNRIYGAREMRRAIQKYVDDKIAKMIIAKELNEGELLLIHDLDNFEVSDDPSLLNDI